MFPNSIQSNGAASNKQNGARVSGFKVQRSVRNFLSVRLTEREVEEATSAAQQLLSFETRSKGSMSLVRLLGYTTLACGCVVGRYREVASSRELAYVEEKGLGCGSHGHRRNHTVVTERLATVSPIVVAAKAS
jgi:hypothetical protein